MKRLPILLLHGFSASPWELKELASHLKKKGHRVSVPLLAGHGAGRAEFDKNGIDEWMASAEKALRSLKKPKNKVIIIGHSMGGVLAAMLAEAHPGEIDSLILAAPAFRLSVLTAPLTRIPLVRFLKPTLRFPSPRPDAKHWTREYASHRIAELQRLGRMGTRPAKRLTLPLLMLQAKVDDLVSRRYNEKLFKKIPSASKKLMVYDVKEHNVFHHYNPMQRQVFEWVDDFLERR